jgi:type IV fimbrial biogenesis protein FimT
MTRPARVIGGVTLVELLIAVAVAAALITLAAPSFRDLILMQRLKGIHAQLVTDLQFARSEAISRGVEVNVRVQPSGALPGSCYIVFTDTTWDYRSSGASQRCNCRLAPGSRCTQSGTFEIRTVDVPADSDVALSLPLEQTAAVAFDPVTGGMVLTLSETGVGTGNDFTVYSGIDVARKLAAVVGLSGRPTVCRPTGSTMNERPC